MASPCGDGYTLIGDICEPIPAGYVETRSECEMAVDSREAAGVEQNYAMEIAKCREEATAAEMTEAAPDASTIDGFFSWLLSEIAKWFGSVQII